MSYYVGELDSLYKERAYLQNLLQKRRRNAEPEWFALRGIKFYNKQIVQAALRIRRSHLFSLKVQRKAGKTRRERQLKEACSAIFGLLSTSINYLLGERKN